MTAVWLPHARFFDVLERGRDVRWALDGQTVPHRDASFFLRPVPGEHVIEVSSPYGRDAVRFSIR